MHFNSEIANTAKYVHHHLVSSLGELFGGEFIIFLDVSALGDLFEDGIAGLLVLRQSEPLGKFLGDPNPVFHTEFKRTLILKLLNISINIKKSFKNMFSSLVRVNRSASSSVTQTPCSTHSSSARSY